MLILDLVRGRKEVLTMGKKNHNKTKNKKNQNKEMTNMEMGQELGAEIQKNDKMEKRGDINFAKK